MAKLTLSDVANLQNESSAVGTLAPNNRATEAALLNTLSRDGTAPNNMEADLDMDSNRILNLPVPVSGTEPVRLQDLTEGITGPQGAQGLTGPQGLPGTTLDWVNVRDFGAVGDDVTDDTAAIQAAIDYAFANGLDTVYVPCGKYKCTDTIYFDSPSNRADPANPVVFNFSKVLLGDFGSPNQEGAGSIINHWTNDHTGVLVGPGQGMAVRNINITGPSIGLSRGQQNSAGIGLGICGGNGGNTRSYIENVLVSNFYSGFKTGGNGNTNLGDSNTFIKCWVFNAKYGFYFGQTQNFINTLIDCQPEATYGVYNPLGVDIRVMGGNYTNWGVVNAYDVTAISAITAAGSANSYAYTLTAHITTPDSHLTAGANGTILNVAAFETANFGIVPCVVTGYNAGTQVISLKIYPTWGFFHFGGVNAQADTNLQANLQACTTLFAAERVTTFLGNSMTIEGVHIENPGRPTCLLDAITGFGGNRPVVMKNIFFNFDPSNNDYKTGGASTRAAYMCAAAHFPLITTSSDGVENATQDITLLSSVLGSPLPLLLDICGTSSIKVEDCRLAYFNVRGGDNGSKIQMADTGRRYYAGGIFLDEGRFGVFDTATTWRNRGWGQSPTWGWRPAPWTTPCVRTGDAVTLAGVLGSLGTYPILWGGQRYRETSFTGDVPKEFWSDHNFYSYGQNITGLNWDYRGQSHVVYCDNTGNIFPGLGVILNDGGGDVEYVVTTMCPELGYFTVARFAGTGLLNGTKTVDYADTVIKQAPYAITVF